MSSNESDNQEIVQIAVRKSNKQQKNKQAVIKPRNIKIKKQQKSSSKVNELKKKLRNSLRQKFEQQKIFQELKKIPINLGQRQNKMIKIDDTVVQKKQIKGLGIKLVQKNRRQIRKPDARLQLQLDRDNKSRASFSQIRALKRSKK